MPKKKKYVAVRSPAARETNINRFGAVSGT